MPVNKSMTASMKKQYGKKQGESVYYAVETKQKKAKSSKKKKAK